MKNEDGNDICGYIKDNDQPCGLVAGWGRGESVVSGRCRHHFEDERGAPEGNDYAKDNPGGDGAPEGHFRNLDTGERTSADRWMEFIENHADDRFEELYKLYFAELTDEGATPTQAARIARLWTRADWNEMELIEEEFETEHYYEGEFIGMEFDSDRDGSVLRTENAARLLRREEELSPYSQQSSGTEVLIKGDSVDANISHERVSSDSDSNSDSGGDGDGDGDNE